MRGSIHLPVVINHQHDHSNKIAFNIKQFIYFQSGVNYEHMLFLLVAYSNKIEVFHAITFHICLLMISTPLEYLLYSTLMYFI